ncbi:squalene synthase HpnC [Herbaspirillum sp. Sphag1AN]|uniref:squalene synthase HpnC n=1 Tax=unclassified Herbaspirillum TaxID=2624150 RepID=UPI001616F699|nr:MULTISPECIES: squalene synthase HpnC [unclassified Herbaspirillum]MBB3212009.1 squalene synthase HpnC [Herbaspirillum sp. Sphag1AN]MBB3244157.1 squalene synthase HpnC [Herbaspirillum sp. Sphag64]
MAVDHYENFPVASLLLPARLRPAVKAIYAFARSADDIADEGDATDQARLSALRAYEEELNRIETGQASTNQLFVTLSNIVKQYALPLTPLRDLLSAFQQDVSTTRYHNFDTLLDYCRRSANPVGALMLHLYQAANPDNLRDSNAICSALQLINFWQDIAIDWRKQRIYLPLEDLQNFGIKEEHIAQEIADTRWHTMMQFQISRARALLCSGAPLALRLPGRIGWELRLVVQGGLRILERLEQVQGDIFQQRPTLGLHDWIIIGWRALRMSHTTLSMHHIPDAR